MPPKTELDRRAFLQHLLALPAAGIALMLDGCASAPQAGPAASTTAPTLPPSLLPTSVAPTGTTAELPVSPTDLPPATVRTAPRTSVVAPTSSSPTAAPTAVPTTPAASPNPHPTNGGTPMPTSRPTTDETPIRIIIGDTVLTGRLWDNATARDLIAQLPLTLTFSDYHGQEKLAPLPRKLSMDGVPAGADPLPRDIGYYAPAGVVVFYYSDVGYFNGIVRIGQFDGDMDAITSQTIDFVVRIELAVDSGYTAQ